MAAELRRQTIGEALNLTGSQYRMYTAVHEIGHATAGLATGECFVEHCRLTIAPAAPADGYADVRFDGQHAHLVILHGGLIAQEHWLRRTGLWSERRGRAARDSAGHDLDAIVSLNAPAAAVTAARGDAYRFLTAHWRGVLTAADRLCERGFLHGDELCDVINHTRFQ